MSGLLSPSRLLRNLPVGAKSPLGAHEVEVSCGMMVIRRLRHYESRVDLPRLASLAMRLLLTARLGARVYVNLAACDCNSHVSS